jgi:hypothetical protein
MRQSLNYKASHSQGANQNQKMINSNFMTNPVKVQDTAMLIQQQSNLGVIPHKQPGQQQSAEKQSLYLKKNKN